MENIKSAMDEGNKVGALLMDLSKAFDCLPHGLLISKFHAYGVDMKSCSLLCSYFSDRYQRVKIGKHVGEWQNINKGAPQGSIMGPFAYNVHCNDLLCLLLSSCQLYNYADDNTICCAGRELSDIKFNIEAQASILIDWFKSNYMKVNPDKFQAIIFSMTKYDPIQINVNNCVITTQEEVKLLGVTFDEKLSFDTHVSNICRKAGKQLSVLKRLSNTLSEEGKLLVYNTFIFSNFNYCCIIWHFCTISNARKVEKVQERSLRYVFNDFVSSYNSLLERSNKSHMYINRIRIILQYVFKVISGDVPMYLIDMYKKDESSRNTRCYVKLLQPKFKSFTHGFNSVGYQGSRIWNSLPNDIKESTTYNKFKSNISKWKASACQCTICPLCKLHVI